MLYVFSSEFRSDIKSILTTLDALRKGELKIMATVTDVDTALAAQDNELTSLSGAVSANTAALQKLAANVPADLQPEVTHILNNNTAIATALQTVAANDANPGGAPTTAPSS